jgi:ADP-heptose:LPS heptosyltransferase
MTPARASVGEPERILVTRIRRIGDVILSLPVLDALRVLFPHAAIDYLAEEGPAAAAIGHPALRRVLTLRPGAWPGLPAAPDILLALRSARYDWVFDLYGNPRSALLARITGAPVRVGPARQSRRRFFTHAIPPQDPTRSAIEYHLSALRALGVEPGPPRPPRIYLSEAERLEGMARVDALLPPGGQRVGLHVGNRWAAKRWPEERFGALLRALPKLGARGVVLAGPGEEAHARRVAEAARGQGRGPAPVLAGIPLRSYFGVVAALDALVTNDGSPLHAGPALGVPTVGILGPTVPEIWFPYSGENGHQLLCKPIWCRPCHRHECARLDCLEWIEVAEAVAATARALAQAGRVRASA